MTPISVGLGEFKASRNPEEVLVCYGLGSCVGVAFYDPVVCVGALVHVVLPDSGLARSVDVVGKFADTAVPAAVAEMLKLGGQVGRLSVRLAGGARMLQVAGLNARLDIGARNLEAVRLALERCRLKVAAADTGGTYGRTMSLFIQAGRVTVRTAGRGEKIL
jgi:chemotaxis protein CheD